MLLEVVDGDHATSLLDKESVLVDATWTLRLLVHLADLEDVVETIQRNLDDLVVHHLQQVAQGLDAALRNEVANLRRLLETTGSGVRDRPASLLLGLEVGSLEDVDERRDDVRVNDSLNLLGRAGRDVRDGPASLLPNAVLRRGEKGEKSGEGAGCDDNLGLEVVTSNDVANRPESRRLNGRRGVHKEVHETPADTRLDDGLNLIVRAIGKVRDCPASVNEDLVVERVYKLGQYGQCRRNLAVD